MRHAVLARDGEQHAHEPAVPQRRHRRFGERRSTGSHVKNARRSAGSLTPRTSRPAEGEPTATDERQRIGLARRDRGARSRAGGSTRGATCDAGGDTGEDGAPSVTRRAATAATVASASAAPITGRTPGSLARGGERILTSYGGALTCGPAELGRASPMTAYDASEWTDFFVAGAGASAALASTSGSCSWR